MTGFNHAPVCPGASPVINIPYLYRFSIYMVLINSHDRILSCLYELAGSCHVRFKEPISTGKKSIELLE